MAAVSSIIAGVTAAAALAGTAHAVESSNHARRLAGQEKDRQQHDADVAMAKIKEEENQQDRVAMREQSRFENRRRLLSGGSSYQSPLAPVGGSSIGGGNNSLGS